ncbi:MAG: radical SAM protein [Desulfovibrio sp.]|jgi:radical SAM superfamily enzyme YgiQ (UPF0313 family)|nr:radical SAM protein [Desulfovibrio sp.]
MNIPQCKIVLVNAPFVRHGDSGVFLGLDRLVQYDLLKESFCSSNGPEIAHSLLPYSTGIRYGVRAGSRWPHTAERVNYNYVPFPFIMAYTSAFLRKNGIETEIIDCVAIRQYSYDTLLNDLKKRKPDIVIVEGSYSSIDIDLWLCNMISAFSEVALAGPCVNDFTAKELCAEHPAIRYFLKGEYINSALEMVLTRRAGIYELDVVKDLDSIPTPDRTFFGAQLARDYWIPNMPVPQLQMWGSKGCAFRCSFCLWPSTMYGNNVSLRDPKYIAKEIATDVKCCGYQHVYFDDDTFNIGNERIEKLCLYMKELGLPWGIMARIDTSPLELFEKMISCGCVGMKFGIESFNLDVLKRINKGFSSRKTFDTLRRLTRQYPRVKFHLTTMRNLPGQTDAIFEQDQKILKNLGFMENNPYRTFQLSSCVPFPGTPLYAETAKRHGKEKMEDCLRYDGTQDTIMQDLHMA